MFSNDIAIIIVFVRKHNFHCKRKEMIQTKPKRLSKNTVILNIMMKLMMPIIFLKIAFSSSGPWKKSLKMAKPEAGHSPRPHSVDFIHHFPLKGTGALWSKD